MYIKDLTTGSIREYGKDQHDSLMISHDGKFLQYYNLHNGEDSYMGNYRFVTEDGVVPKDDEVLEKHGANAYFNIGGFKKKPEVDESKALGNITNVDIMKCFGKRVLERPRVLKSDKEILEEIRRMVVLEQAFNDAFNDKGN